MKSYPTDHVRNILIVGHGGAGKTSLVEAVCHATGATNRVGRVEDGTTVTDFEPEEVRKQISVSLAVAPVEHQGGQHGRGAEVADHGEPDQAGQHGRVREPVHDRVQEGAAARVPARRLGHGAVEHVGQAGQEADRPADHGLAGGDEGAGAQAAGQADAGEAVGGDAGLGQGVTGRLGDVAEGVAGLGREHEGYLFGTGTPLGGAPMAELGEASTSSRPPSTTAGYGNMRW